MTLYFASLNQAIVISQVLYDPVGTENGGEAIELWNENDTLIDISGWTIKSRSSEVDATIPQGTLLFPGDYYLIADVGWNTTKDNASWRAADHEEALTLANTDAGVALKNGSRVIDAVGWGSVVDQDLFEGMPSNGTGQGKSLHRLQDTNNNLADFAIETPDFFERSSSTQEIVISIPVEEEGAEVGIESIALTDDLPEQGVQILPLAGQERLISVIANISGNETSEVSVEIEGSFINLSEEQPGIWAGVIPFSYTNPAGTYEIVLHASTPSESAELNSSFEWLSLLALDIDTEALQFPRSNPGDILRVLGDQDGRTSSAPTIKNIGNTILNIGLSATRLSDGIQSFPSEQIICSLDNDFGSSLSLVLEEEMQVIERSLSPGEVTPLGMEVHIPQSASSGTLRGSTLVTAVGAS
ncbi:lamin tail domain-containing protein [Candidatus Woesearchaeota archaeon]|nr:lamin tail domain-containing protein [Candidatus Woesearchaeota archaeon]